MGMGKSTADKGQPDNEPAPPLPLRTLWGLRRRLQAYADSRGLALNTSAIILLDDALKAKGFE